MSWLQTRESSTLVIATFLASASLLLLTVDKNVVQINVVAPVGFTFALLGLSYRQITTWTTDRIQHNRQVDLERFLAPYWQNRREGEARFWRNRPDVYLVYASVREFIVISFLSIPIMLWWLVGQGGLDKITELLIYNTMVCAIAVGLFLTGIDLGIFRRHDWDKHY